MNTPKGTVQKRERKPAAGKERSAMEEYLVFRVRRKRKRKKYGFQGCILKENEGEFYQEIKETINFNFVILFV